MKVIEAFWEQRNLGENALEVILEKEDCEKNPKYIYEEISLAEKKYHSTYTVVKIKTGFPWIGDWLQKNGYVHIETQISMKAEINDVLREMEQYHNLFKSARVEMVSEKFDVDHLKQEIRKGIFFTDRIALDPKFGVKKANDRYANWLEDEAIRGAKVCYVYIDEDRVGFYVWRQHGNKATLILAGKFSKYVNHWMIGGYIFFAGHQRMIQDGVNKWYGDVSANNENSYRLYQMFGYRIRYFSDVYIRHAPQNV